MLEKARQKKSIVKNFMNLENFKRESDKSYYSTYSDQADFKSGGKKYDDFDLLYGLENEQTQDTWEKIKQSKQKKGRGLLLSFYEFN